MENSKPTAACTLSSTTSDSPMSKYSSAGSGVCELFIGHMTNLHQHVRFLCCSPQLLITNAETYTVQQKSLGLGAPSCQGARGVIGYLIGQWDT
ncbi:hypothetical protein BDN67DRAFT_145860 [Paxillus ammoniavirescens]|nr:hypothetical protein BDN67DRAFT_145860 [Paxillus ammoniavirescens]